MVGKVIYREEKYRYKKKGKLLISHRYNHIPLLDSSPGGVCRSWSYKTYPVQKYKNFISLQKKSKKCERKLLVYFSYFL